MGVSLSDYRVYVKVRLDMPWVPVPYNTYAVSSIKVLQDGSLLAPGIGTGEMSQLFTRWGGRAQCIHHWRLGSLRPLKASKS